MKINSRQIGTRSEMSLLRILMFLYNFQFANFFLQRLEQEVPVFGQKGDGPRASCFLRRNFIQKSYSP